MFSGHFWVLPVSRFLKQPPLLTKTWFVCKDLTASSSYTENSFLPYRLKKKSVTVCANDEKAIHEVNSEFILEELQVPCQAVWIFLQLWQTVIVYLTWILIVVRLLAHFLQLQFSFWQFHIHHLKFLFAAMLFTFFSLDHNLLNMTILLFLHYDDFFKIFWPLWNKKWKLWARMTLNHCLLQLGL